MVMEIKSGIEIDNNSEKLWVKLSIKKNIQMYIDGLNS